MTLDQFITKYTNKSVSHPNGIKGQCVALYRRYLTDVLEAPQSPSVVGAQEIAKTYRKDTFTRLDSILDARRGDVVVWSDELGNTYGHVGIFLDNTIGGFRSFDSNWRNDLTARIEKHHWKSVSAVLRPKRAILDDMELKEQVKRLHAEVKKLTSEVHEATKQAEILEVLLRKEKKEHGESVAEKTKNYNLWQKALDRANKCEEDRLSESTLIEKIRLLFK